MSRQMIPEHAVIIILYVLCITLLRLIALNSAKAFNVQRIISPEVERGEQPFVNTLFRTLQIFHVVLKQISGTITGFTKSTKADTSPPLCCPPVNAALTESLTV